MVAKWGVEAGFGGPVRSLRPLLLAYGPLSSPRGGTPREAPAELHKEIEGPDSGTKKAAEATHGIRQTKTKHRVTLCYAIVLPGRKSAFRAGFWPDCYQENTEKNIIA